MRKATVKIVQYAVVGFLLLIALPLVVMYVAATMTPSDYQPLRERMSEADRKEVANRCISDYMTNFQSMTEDVKPFTWSLTEKELNLYVSSIDEIVWTGEAGVGGKARSQMENLGLTGWCVALTDEGIKVMVKSTRYDKVLSATLAFQSAPGNQMRVGIERVRMGKLALPKSVIVSALTKLKEQLGKSRREGSAGKKHGGAKLTANLGAMLENVLQMAIDNKPQEAILTGFVKPTRIEKVETAGGTLTFHFRPVRRTAATAEAGNP